VDELGKHRIVVLGGWCRPGLQQSGKLAAHHGPRWRTATHPWLTINNVLGVLRACQRGIGIAMLPDYLVEENGGLVSSSETRAPSPTTPISSIRKN